MKGIMLRRLQRKFIELVKEYQLKEGIEQQEVAARVGMDPPRLSSLITDSRFARAPLSATYLEPFIWKRIITVADIYDGKPKSTREVEFWERMNVAERADLTNIMVQIEKAGVDLKTELLNILIRIRQETPVSPK